MSNWTEADVARVMGKRAKSAPQNEPILKRSKYRNVPTIVDGITFDSGKEADRYQELKLLHKAGVIWDLQLQPCFQLFAHALAGGRFVYVGEYSADFQYSTGNSEKVIEDVKSTATLTEAYRLRKKLAEACHGIRITEIFV